MQFQAACVFLQSGEHERGLDLMEPLMTMPASDLTPAYLRIDPQFMPVMGNSRFQRLLRM